SGKRVIVYAKIVSIDIENSLMVFACEERAKFQIFSRQYNIYIRGNERSILFKQARCRFNASRLAITLPNEVRLLEQRKHNRLDFSKSKKGVGIVFSKRVATGVGKQRSFDAQIINLSSQGLCIEFDQELGKFFYTSDCLLISQIDSLKFKPHREAE